MANEEFQNYSAMLEVHLIWTRKMWTSSNSCAKVFLQIMYFNWCLIPHTTVCKHSLVHTVTLLQHGMFIPPSWRR